MVTCNQCATQNSLDSTFCKKCGAPISEVEVQEARERLETLVAEGNHALNEGRTEEALAIADSVLHDDPNSTTALWLKAICHERKNEIPLALECADRIVELNPDSDLDKIRRSQLRTKLSASLHPGEQPDRRVAMIGAVAACVVVLCLGLLVATMLRDRSSNQVATNFDPAANRQPVTQPTDSGQNPTTPASQKDNNSQTNNQNSMNSPTLRGPGVGDVPPVRDQNQTQDDPTPTRRWNGGQLPNPDGSPLSGSVGPVTLDGDPGRPTQTNPSNPETAPSKVGTDPGTDPNAPQGNFAVNQKPADDPGQIVIDVHSAKGASSTGVQTSPPDPNNVKNQTQVAYSAFMVGHYEQAAGLFQQALRNGGDPVVLNQRLGQTYERMGRVSDAVDSYRRAVQAGQAAIAQGRPNPTGIQAIVDSCSSALKKLGS